MTKTYPKMADHSHQVHFDTILNDKCDSLAAAEPPSGDCEELLSNSGDDAAGYGADCEVEPLSPENKSKISGTSVVTQIAGFLLAGHSLMELTFPQLANNQLQSPEMALVRVIVLLASFSAVVGLAVVANPSGPQDFNQHRHLFWFPMAVMPIGMFANIYWAAKLTTLRAPGDHDIPDGYFRTVISTGLMVLLFFGLFMIYIRKCSPESSKRKNSEEPRDLEAVLRSLGMV